MYDFFHALIINLNSAPILFFVLGSIAGFLKSDLEVPGSISRFLSIYLMMAIGFKGGVSIALTPTFSATMLYLIIGGLALSFLQPFLGYSILKRTTDVDSPTLAALAAQYGSVSMVTFATAVSLVEQQNIAFAGYVVAILALMEAPAILSGLFIAHREAPDTNTHDQEEKHFITHEIYTNGAILLLLGSFCIGCSTGAEGLKKLGGFIDHPFQGFLCLFLLDMGITVAQNITKMNHFSWQLISFGFYMPILGGILGAILAYAIGTSVGTGFLFITLSASASYIAVPAAMRMVLPEANPSIYAPMSLAITFPFNVTIGLPIYLYIARLILS